MLHSPRQVDKSGFWCVAFALLRLTALEKKEENARSERPHASALKYRVILILFTGGLKR